MPLFVLGKLSKYFVRFVTALKIYYSLLCYYSFMSTRALNCPVINWSGNLDGKVRIENQQLLSIALSSIFFSVFWHLI